MKDLFLLKTKRRRFGRGAQRIIELPDAVVYPGFTDGHQHLEGIGRRTRSLSLFGPTCGDRLELHWSRTVKEGD